MAESAVIEFECPRCLKNIRVGIDQAAQRMDCPSCQQSLLVPSRSGAPGIFDDLFDSTSGPNTGAALPLEDLEKASSAKDTNRSSEPVEVDPIAELSVDGESNAEKTHLPETDPDAPLKVEGGEFYCSDNVSKTLAFRRPPRDFVMLV